MDFTIEQKKNMAKVVIARIEHKKEISDEDIRSFLTTYIMQTYEVKEDLATKETNYILDLLFKLLDRRAA